MLLGFAETDCVRVEPGVAQMYERLATFLKMPTTGRAVRCFWEELKYGAVARRHACTGGQMRLVPADLEEVKWSIAPWLRGAGGYLDVSALSGAYN